MRRLAIAVALALAVALVYGQVREFEFLNYDDSLYVYENNRVRTGWTLDGVGWALTTDHAYNWHPLTWLSLMTDVHFFGVDPGAMHAVNAVLHAINAILVFLLLDALTGASGRSAFVAGLFALHPLHVESVAWITERKDVLSTLFWLLATGSWAAWAITRRRIAWFAGIVCMALGLMAKPMLVTLPFALLLLDVWPLRRIRFDEMATPARVWPLVREKLPLFALSLVSSLVTMQVQIKTGLDLIPFGARLTNAGLTYARYLGHAAWPGDLAIFYPYASGWPLGVAALVMALLVAATLGAVWLWRRAPYVLAGWLFFLGTLVPTIGLVQVGAQSMADRYTYVPLLGVFWIVAWGVPDLVQRGLGSGRAVQVALTSAAAAVLVGLGVQAHAYTARWRDPVALFSHAVEAVPDNYLAHDRLGDALLKQGQLAPAIVHLSRTLELRPGLWSTHADLGEAYEQQGDLRRAERSYRTALQFNAEYTRGRNKLGRTLAKQGRIEEAIPIFEQSVSEDPEDPEAYESLGILAEMFGDTPTALTRYRQALEREPGFIHSRRRAGWLLATSSDPTLRDGAAAVVHFQEMCERTRWNEAADLDGLAAALAEAGRFQEAGQMAERASALAARNGDAGQAGLSRERARLYASGRPLRLE